MNEDQIKSVMLQLADEIEEENAKNLTIEEKLAIQIIGVEKKFFYSTESFQRKKQIREILNGSIGE